MKLSQTILLAENREDDVLLLERAFNSIGVQDSLRVVRDGDQAITYLKGEGVYSDRAKYPFPVLVLTDLKMPKKSGFDVLRFVRETPEICGLPVVVFTSSEETNDVRRAYEMRVNSYVSKPHSFSDLVQTLKALHQYWVRTNQNMPMPMPVPA